MGSELAASVRVVDRIRPPPARGLSFDDSDMRLGFIAGSEWSVILGAIGAQGACASAA